MEIGEIVPILLLLVKGSALIAFALLVTALMKHRAASGRHMVCALCLAGVLLLPLLSLSLPAWQVPVKVPALASASSAIVPQAAVKTSESETTVPPSNTTGVPTTSPVNMAPADTNVTAATPPAGSVSWPLMVMGFYAAGLLITAIAILCDLVAAQRLWRTCVVADDFLVQAAGDTARSMGVRRPVTVLCGTNVTVPMTLGMRRPTILLPLGAKNWDGERLRVALLHEAAHIRRGDFAWQIIARLACALHWCNPLCWLLARRMREEAERACDDQVLAGGITATEYADMLLTVARNLSSQRVAPAAVAMARQSDLGKRLGALLAAQMDRRGLSLRHGLTLAMAITVILLPLAALRSRLAPQAETTENIVVKTAETIAVKTDASPVPPLQKPGVFRQRLADGTQVELVAVTRLPYQGKPIRWWRPDGTPGSGPLPYHPGKEDHRARDKEEEWEFLLRVTGPGREGRGRTWKSITTSSGGGLTTGDALPSGEYSPKLSRLSLILPKGTTTATFRFGVAPAKWEDTSVHLETWALGGSGGGTTAAGRVIDQVSYGRTVVTRLDPYDAGNKEELGTFRHLSFSNIPEEEMRWVAETAAGKIVEGHSVSGISTTNDVTSEDLFFPGLRPEQIKEMRLQTRPYEWIEFANVALSEPR